MKIVTVDKGLLKALAHKQNWDDYKKAEDQKRLLRFFTTKSKF